MGIEGTGWGELPPGDQDTKQCSQGAPAPQRTAQGKQSDLGNYMSCCLSPVLHNLLGQFLNIYQKHGSKWGKTV